MDKIIIVLLFTIILPACVQHNNNNDVVHETIERTKIKIEDAEGFHIVYRDNYIKIKTNSLLENSFFEDSLFVLKKEMPNDFVAKRKIVPAKWKSICCQSSTHLAFLYQLNKMNLVTGLCGMQYVHNDNLMRKLKANNAKEVCIGEATQTEALLAQNPDLYLTYPFSAEQNVKLKKQGVKTFMIAEYLERDPIARLEWIKLFGVMFNQEKEATDYFRRVKENYETLRINSLGGRPTFFMNLPFGDTWYAPSFRSMIVSLIEDAGMSYYFRTDLSTENKAYPVEEIWDVGARLEYWVIIADRPKDFSLDDLIAENEVYSTFKSVKRKQVIFCNTSTSDYFTTGVLEPDVMLKDILHATNKYPDHDPVYFHLLN